MNNGALAKPAGPKASFGVPMFSARTDWPLVPNRLSEAVERRRREGLPILDLTESNPTRCGFDYEPAQIFEALANPRALTYQPDPRGLLAAREVVASYYAERGVGVRPERIFLTASTSEAYSYIFRLLANPGDNVLVPRPSYPLLDFLARLDDVELFPFPLAYDRGWSIDLERLPAIITPRTRALVIVHPNNPTGSFVCREELDFLVGCCKKHGLALVADEVFADYAFAPDSARVHTHAAVCDVLTFTLSGLSKISALPQMKLAWMVVNGPGELLEDALARLEVIADTYLSVSQAVAEAVPELLEVRHALQPQILSRLRSNLRWLDSQLSQDSLLGRLETEGGWYLILRVPSVRSDEEWALELLTRDGVLVHPGHFYDFPSEGYLVASLLPTPEIFQEAITKLLARVTTNS